MRAKSRHNKRPNKQEKHKFDVIYTTASTIVGSADPETFAKIPPSKIKLYIDHVIEQLEKKTIDEHWVRTETVVVLDAKNIVDLVATFYCTAGTAPAKKFAREGRIRIILGIRADPPLLLFILLLLVPPPPL